MAQRVAKGRIWLALHKLFPSSPKTLRRIGESCQGQVELLPSLPEKRSVELLGKATAEKLSLLPFTIKQVKGEWEELRAQGVNVVPFTDIKYPRNVQKIDGIPPILYMRGNSSLLKDQAIGICGSRNASELGIRNAMKLGASSGRLGLNVVSGYPKGVDTAAHQGAICSHGSSIIVLADGINRFKIKRGFEDASDFFQRTLVISQFYPKQTWHVGAAMARNVLICGLSEAVAVVEAGPTGGTIASGRECLAQGKPLWVIDYEGLPPAAAGNRILISEGGKELRNLREWFFALYDVLTNPKGSRGTMKSEVATGQLGVRPEHSQYELSSDSLEEQLKLFESTVRI